MYKKAVSLFVLLFLFSCQGLQQKDVSTDQVIEQGTAQSREFFSSERKYNELFRIFASVKYYQSKQYEHEKKITLKEDVSGNAYFQEQLKPFNRVNYFGYAVLKIELHSDSGKIARVRSIRSSGVQEIDKLIFDDVLRLQFAFKSKEITPQSFYIGYAVYLTKAPQILTLKK